MPFGSTGRTAQDTLGSFGTELKTAPSYHFTRVAARLFGEDHITEIRLTNDRMGLLLMTRDRDALARALGRIALDGHRIEAVVPADENVDALYGYLIGGQ